MSTFSIKYSTTTAPCASPFVVESGVSSGCWTRRREDGARVSLYHCRESALALAFEVESEVEGEPGTAQGRYENQQ